MGKQTERYALPAIGGSTLMVILAVVSLCVFALLSYMTVQAEKRLSDIAAEAAVQYYEADLQAEELFARLRSGEFPEGVTAENGRYCYAVTVSGTQMLEVELEKQGESWSVLRWQTVAQPGKIRDEMAVWRDR